MTSNLDRNQVSMGIFEKFLKKIFFDDVIKNEVINILEILLIFSIDFRDYYLS